MRNLSGSTGRFQEKAEGAAIAGGVSQLMIRRELCDERVDLLRRLRNPRFRWFAAQVNVQQVALFHDAHLSGRIR
jgi:hypothetical protein